LKVAPEHLDHALLKMMRKPGPEVFEKFLRFFQKHAPDGQYLIPYLMSAFPGSNAAAMDRMAGWFRRRSWRPRQVQAFIPTPGTVATAMYYAGLDEGGRPIYVAKSDRDRQAQHRHLSKD
jgi:radical SAM superfamily enzyme YgiQ (UPF0313 family)